MNIREQPETQKWVRTLVEVYRVERGVDTARLLELARSTEMCCEDFYTDEEDGYTGGWAEDKSFQLSSGKMQVTTVELVGDPEDERTLLRVSRIPFNVTLHKRGIPYERILFAIKTSVSSERLTEASQYLDDPDDPTIDLEKALQVLYLEVNSHRLEPSIVEI